MTLSSGFENCYDFSRAKMIFAKAIECEIHDKFFQV